MVTRDLKIEELLLLTTKLGSEFQMGIMLIKKRGHVGLSTYTRSIEHAGMWVTR